MIHIKYYIHLMVNIGLVIEVLGLATTRGEDFNNVEF